VRLYLAVAVCVLIAMLDGFADSGVIAPGIPR